jgi:DNA-dependent RNA polymerase auxiliary subunit epsilon
MPFFKVNVSRSQVQTQTFTVEASSKSDLRNALEQLDFDFGFIDERFDEAEVDSIDYEVGNIEKVAKPDDTSFADEDLQELLNESNTN